MKIAFNGIGCGWGNNGGTQSVFRLAGALADLGHEVQIWSNTKNKFTWFDLHPGVDYRKRPDRVDALINSGCATTMSTYQHKEKKVGIQWLRAHETWAASESQLLNMYSLDMPLWVNSEWMQQMIATRIRRKDVEVQYCGIPHADFYPAAARDPDKFVIGALHSTKKRKRFSDVMVIKRAMHQVRDLEFQFFGDEQYKGDNHVRRPCIDTKRKLYSRCNVWLATSVNEGLHIPPMEAAMCGATVVAQFKPSAGNMDYCIDGKTGLTFSSPAGAVRAIYKIREIQEYGSQLTAAMQDLIKTKIGDVETNARRMVARLERLIGG
jgi:glycosyltransferase involved in cell wall biosynthesis